MKLQWLASSEWANIVQALLHTLWQGMIIAVLLGFALRRLVNPITRYRCALTALAGVMLAGLVTWAILNRPIAQPISNSPTVAAKSPATSPLRENNTPVVAVSFLPPTPDSATLGWTAWLALVWLAGAILMLGRAGFQVAGAERLRRTSRPLVDSQIIGLLNNARQAVGLARRVRLAVTDKLTSPAVVGVLVPTLILPLSLTTTLTAEQIRFVLLHELAHVRRGDYIAGLFQLFAEALLFFNPAVWWISRQVRIEREVCCDTLAIELSGAPVDYARTLVHVAENVLSAASLAAPAFGGQREPSSLADRVQRMLVPGYRPALRLTWRAMLFALVAGGGLLFLSALGTRATIAAILSPQERIDRIERKMAELGEKPMTVNENSNPEDMPKVQISGTIRTIDGSPLPEWIGMNVTSKLNTSSSGTFFSAQNGVFTNSILMGNIYLSAEVTNFAPAFIGPLDGISTNRFVDLKIVLQRGFDVPLQLVDADSGKPVLDANISTIFWLNNNGFQYHFWKSSADGSVTLTHCVELPMDIVVKAPGYEIVQKRFEHLRAGEPLVVAMKRGLTLSGVVLDQATGQPIAGAEVRVLYQSGATEPRRFEWNDTLHVLAKADSQGAFILNQLAADARYYFGVSAPGHASVICKDIMAGPSKLVVQLGSELIIRGHVLGNLDLLQQNNNDRVLSSSVTEKYGDNSYGNGDWVPLHVTNGVATFQFTNRTIGLVKLSTRDGGSVEREISAPVDDWVIDLNQLQTTQAKILPKREVIFRFQNSFGISPRGTVQVTIPSNLDPKNLTSLMQDLEITNGEVHAQIAIGGETSIEPRHMVGYWFNRAGNWTSPTGESGNLFSIMVEQGAGPLIIDISLIPAGAIYARGHNADGTLASGLLFGVTELKRAPGRDQNSLDGGANFPIDAPRQWISGPLPLGGKYQVYAWRGNTFGVSEPVKLTESNPDAAVELQLAPGKNLAGMVLDADGQPVRGAELKFSFTLPDGHSFGFNSLYTDAHGHFGVTDATPDVGEYAVEINLPGLMAVRVPLDFSSPSQTIRLQRGRTLAGQVVEAGTGNPIPDMEVRALDYESNKLPMVTTHTDADGHFEFTTLGDLNYTLYPDGGELIGRPASGNLKFRADGRTNLTLKVKLYPWSKAQPKMPPAKLLSSNANPTAIQGVLANPQFTKALRLLQSHNGAESLNEPEVVTRKNPRQANAIDQSVEGTLLANLAGTYGTPSIDSKVETNLLVQDGKLLYEMDKLDESAAKLKTAVTLDPENKAAKYYANLINQSLSSNSLNLAESSPLSHPAVLEQKAIMEVLHRVRLNEIKLEHAPLSIALNVLANAIATNNPAKLTVPFVASPDLDTVTITLNLTNVLAEDVLDIFVMVAVHPPEQAIKYSIEDQGVEFFRKNQKFPTLYQRAYGINPGVFISNLQYHTRVDSYDAIAVTAAVKNYFDARGVDWTAPEGKAVFYNEKLKMLFVKSTLQDFGKIEGAITALNSVAPQVHLKAWFIEAPEGTLEGMANFIILTNQPSALNQLENQVGVLSPADLKTALHILKIKSGTETLAEPEVVMTTGRQSQMRVTQEITVITNIAFRPNGDSAITPESEKVETGPMIDVIPYVLIDGSTINLTAIASLTEFLGYDSAASSKTTYDAAGKPAGAIIKPNFQTQQVVAAMNLKDGQTLVMKRTIPPSVTSSGVPVLGDIPVVGRLFQNQAKTKSARELIILVTATIVDPAGNRVHTNDVAHTDYYDDVAPRQTQ